MIWNGARHAARTDGTEANITTRKNVEKPSHSASGPEIIVVGTSMGAIIGSLYAAGYPADTILALAKQVDWNAIFANEADQ